MVEWALASALGPLTFEALSALERRPHAPRLGAVRTRAGALCVVVLAGNIAIGPARAVGLPLLFGLPVLARASTRDGALARLLEVALAESDPALSDAYRAVSFDAADAHLTRALLAQADVVSAYGSDTTLQAIRAQLEGRVRFIGHGHGLGAAYVARGALTSEASARRCASQLALDVAAYDQRGCLSPQVAWVERGAAVTGERFAALVSDELAQLGTTLPRGSLPVSIASAQLGWRAVSAMRGTLFEGASHAVCFEPEGALRVGPGYRNLQLLEVDGERPLFTELAALGDHLKCLGVAGVDDVAALAARLPGGLAPRVCALGRMQTPPVDALHDGLAAWDGLLRWTELDAS